jgi:uncharacterized protein
MVSILKFWPIMKRSSTRFFFALFLGVEILLMGCTPAPTATPAATPTAISPTTVVTVPPAGQQLPITAEITIGGKRLRLEVAATHQEQAMGLMYRSDLPDDRGMIFPMRPPRFAKFWMKNVPVALDMVFLYEGEIIAIVPQAPPCKTQECPVYGPQDLVDHVLELRSGRAKELGLKVGDEATIVPLP